MPRLLKFVAFCTQNADFPFFIKQKVLNAALLSSILYSCESWFTRSIFPGSTLYMDAVKALLGVRQTTPNLLCLHELGLPSLSGKVRDTQRCFIEKLIAERRVYTDDPFWHTWCLVSEAWTCAVYIRQLLGVPWEIIEQDMLETKAAVEASTGTKLSTYRLSFNPRLEVHSVYRMRENTIPEYHRIVFTKLRLFSHFLVSETGRWSRVPSELRLCPCGEPQTEYHILCRCSMVRNIRGNYDLNFELLGLYINEQDNAKLLCKYIFECYKYFQALNMS